MACRTRQAPPALASRAPTAIRLRVVGHVHLPSHLLSYAEQLLIQGGPAKSAVVQARILEGETTTTMEMAHWETLEDLVDAADCAGLTTHGLPGRWPWPFYLPEIVS